MFNISLEEIEYIGAIYNVSPYIIERINPETGDRGAVYCFKCGNFANALVVDYDGLLAFQKPICRKHLIEMDVEHLGNKSYGILEQLKNHLKLLREN